MPILRIKRKVLHRPGYGTRMMKRARRQIRGRLPKQLPIFSMKELLEYLDTFKRYASPGKTE